MLFKKYIEVEKKFLVKDAVWGCDPLFPFW
jgi:hypothetical protein